MTLFEHIRTDFSAGKNNYYIHASGVGDFNGDGIQDFFGTPVAFGQPIANAVKLLLGNGVGGYREAASEVISGGVPTLFQGREVVVADFNRDGRDDIFVAAHGLDTASADMPGERNVILLSNAAGGLTNATAALPNYADFSHSAAAGDVDNDGDHDLLVGNFRGVGTYKLPYLLINDGKGQFSADTTRMPQQELQASASAFGSSAFADVNGDGRLDMVLGDHGGKNSRVYLNSGNGSFSGARIELPAVTLHGAKAVVLDILAQDFDKDGRTDLVLTGQGFPSHFSDLNGYTGRYIQFLRNSEAGFVDETSVRFPGGVVDENRLQNNFFLGKLDLNRDGHQDIVVRTTSTAKGDESPGTPYLWINDGTGRFASLPYDVFTSSYTKYGKVLEPINADGAHGIDFIGADFDWALYRSTFPMGTGPGFIDAAAHGAPGFNEQYYLARNPQVAAEVVAGRWSSGLAHYLAAGKGQYLDSFAPGTSVAGTVATDTVTYGGARSDYQVVRTSAGFNVVHTASGGRTDALSSIERLTFRDTKMALDIDGNGGQAYRLYQAAFDRTPDLPGLGFQIGALDAGSSLLQVAANFIASPEFQRTYGALDNAAFVTQLYRNVLDRAPDPGGLAFHTGNLATGTSRAEVLMGFSESPENKAALIGVIGWGFAYG